MVASHEDRAPAEVPPSGGRRARLLLLRGRPGAGGSLLDAAGPGPGPRAADHGVERRAGGGRGAGLGRGPLPTDAAPLREESAGTGSGGAPGGARWPTP